MVVDALLKDALVFNVFLKRWDRCDVVIHRGRFLYVGKVEGMGFQSEETRDCGGKPLIPGLIDIHLHIESTLCTPVPFARAVAERGVTTVVSEPHEIANVFGVRGIQEMIRASKGAAADVYYGVPSSVPATSSDLETSGGVVGLEELDRLFRDEPKVICLGEVMNCPDLIAMGPSRAAEFIDYMRREQPFAAVEGHCPSYKGLDLAKVLYMGVDSDHCLQDVEGLEQRLANGMFVEIQEKAVTPEIVDCLLAHDTDGLFCFVTDDVPPNVLVAKGHLDHVLRKALEAGMPLEKAVIAATWSPARRMGFRDRGAIAPGKVADAVLLADRSADFTVEAVFKGGVPVSRCQTAEAGCGETFPEDFYQSIRLPGELPDTLFELAAPQGASKVCCRTMEKNNLTTYTREGRLTLPVEEGRVSWEEAPCNLALVIERHTGKAGAGKGIMTGCIFQGGAVATSYAHDSHNLLVAGDRASDMKMAASWVVRNQGGICVVRKGEVVASLALPVAGLLSEDPMPEIAARVARIQQAMEELGFVHPNPLMSFATLTLPVSPALKLTDKGLVDVGSSTLVELFVKAASGGEVSHLES